MTDALLLANLAATLYMTGLIWFVQIVHYPLFAGVGGDGYARYQARHMNSTGWVVGPPMLLELATAIWLCIVLPGAISYIGMACLGVIWASTATLQVPTHNKLCAGFDASLHRRLVGTNWLRTVLWSSRAGLLLYALWLRLQQSAA